MDRILTIKPTGIQRASSAYGVELPPPISTVRDWLDAGGQAKATTITAMKNFFLGLYADGITWGPSGKIKRLNLFCGNRLEDCIRPQILTIGNSTDTNNGFVTADYVETGSTGGMVGNSSKYLSTGVSNNDAAIPQQNYSCGVYAKFTALTGNTYALGTDTSNRSLAFYNSGNQLLYATGGAGASKTPAAQGWFCGGTTSDAGRGWLNGSTSGFSTTSNAPAMTAGTIEIFRSTSLPLETAVRLAGYYIGQYLTDTEHANLYTRIQAFQTALNRQV